MTVDQVVRDQMVASRAATLLTVDESRELIKVRYVSEPILGEASCILMNTRSIFSQCLDSLVKLVSVGKVGSLSNRGAAGELVSPIILCRAFDLAHESIISASSNPQFDNVDSDNFEPKYVRVIDIVKDENGFERVIESRIKDVSHQTQPHAGSPVHFVRFLQKLFHNLVFKIKYGEIMVD
jgi:hypothetical protein